MNEARALGPLLHTVVGAAILATLSGLGRAGNVHVVDASGNGDFTAIQAAIDASADGDVVLVRPGDYSAFVVDDKGVAIVADVGAAVRVTGTTRIQNLVATREVRLVGLRFVGERSPAALRLLDAEGAIRVERCRLEGPAGFVGGDAQRASNVVLSRCRIFSGEGVYLRAAFSAWNCRIASYDSLFWGHDSHGAADEGSCESPDGADGVDALSGFLFAAGSRFRGGNGGDGSNAGGLGCNWGGPGGDGGHGICANASTAWVLDNAYEPGLPGQCSSGPPLCEHGDPGSPIGCGSAPNVLTGSARSLAIPNPLREGGTFPLTVLGEPGDVVSIFRSEHAGFRFVAGHRGVQTTRQPGPPVLVGTILGSGTLTVAFPTPELNAGVEARTVEFQAVHRTPQGESFLGSPVSLVVLDPAF